MKNLKTFENLYQPNIDETKFPPPGNNDDYDYEGGNWLEPITFDAIKQTIIDVTNEYLNDIDTNDPETIKKIDNLTKQKMFNLWDDLNNINPDEIEDSLK